LEHFAKFYESKKISSSPLGVEQMTAAAAADAGPKVQSVRGAEWLNANDNICLAM
jgi:hypothetical protein